MKAVKINLPEKYIFETEIPVRITDINYVGHLGNDRYLSIVHEARAQFLKSLGYSELDVEGVGTIVNNAVIIYRSQSFHGDQLIVKLALEDAGYVSCNFKYLLINKKTGKEIARAQTGFAFLDYKTGELKEMPGKFRQLFNKDIR